MSLLGVPAEQVRQMRETDSPEVDGCIQRRVDRVFTEVPLARNYFWRVYINGAYSEDCCPNYLRPEYFELLRARVERIHLHTMSLTEFLKSSGNMFSVFVLLDHMDWLTGSERALEEEWTAILRAARACARIIYRSGGLSFDRIPEFAMRQIEFRPDVTGALHGSDRVGTYGSFYLASVRA
jgi:S-adenosylmethionine-diacylglycerol 3-amino-3-carboxypropyl transferase